MSGLVRIDHQRGGGLLLARGGDFGGRVAIELRVQHRAKVCLWPFGGFLAGTAQAGQQATRTCGTGKSTQQPAKAARASRRAGACAAAAKLVQQTAQAAAAGTG